MYPSVVTLRRWSAFATATGIAAAGMMGGRALAGAARDAGTESSLAAVIAILGWVCAGMAAVVIDRSIPAAAAGAASAVLPILWFATLENRIWALGLGAIAVFALMAGLSAAVTRRVLRVASRPRP
jgi:hypothetical protein